MSAAQTQASTTDQEKEERLTPNQCGSTAPSATPSQRPERSVVSAGTGTGTAPKAGETARPAKGTGHGPWGSARPTQKPGAEPENIPRKGGRGDPRTALSLRKDAQDAQGLRQAAVGTGDRRHSSPP